MIKKALRHTVRGFFLIVILLINFLRTDYFYLNRFLPSRLCSADCAPLKLCDSEELRESEARLVSLRCFANNQHLSRAIGSLREAGIPMGK